MLEKATDSPPNKNQKKNGPPFRGACPLKQLVKDGEIHAGSGLEHKGSTGFFDRPKAQGLDTWAK